MRPLRIKERRARTLRGGLSFSRQVFECPSCRMSRATLDEELGLEPHAALTRRFRKKVAWETAQTSFGQSSRNLEHQAELEVSPAECARVAREEGQVLLQAQQQRQQQWAAPGTPEEPAAPPEHQARRLVVEADATAVLTVEGEEHKMVWCASAFALEQRQRKQDSGRELIGLRRYAASSGDFVDFGPQLRGLANRMGARRARAIAFIADGASCLWRWAQENMPEAVLIQDYWHVSEHLYALARELFEPEQARGKGEHWSALLRESRMEELLDELRAEHKRRRGALRERLQREINYLQNGRARMDYARFQREGWPIGSGAIEGTCKHLVKERFNLTGARWKRDNIEPVLALRLSIFNQEWEQDWKPDQLQYG
jgi:hypothetical protein